MAGAENPWPLRLAQEGSAATTITRDCSGSLTRGSSRRTTPFSTTPTTGTGRRWRRCVSKGRGRLARKDVREGQVRLGGELLAQGLAALAPQVGLGGSAWG